MNNNIATHSLRDITDEEISIVKFIEAENSVASYKKSAHRRDDHYLFIFQRSGRSNVVVDFNEIELTGSVILCVLPGQIHYGVSVDKNTEAWLITLDSAYINDDYKVIFDNYYFQPKPQTLSGIANISLNTCIELIASIKENNGQLNFLPQAEHSLISACVGMFASAYHQSENSNSILPRTRILTQQFKQLLLQQFKTCKSTADFAATLNITPAYLNEAVKLSTGFTVGFWIQQTIIMEAKRLLYATDTSIKEIAYLLGFNDHAYFNRYFSNAEGQPPLQFRMKYRK
ncbi:AraC-like DNA-binding protein [Chitinophaga niastensis]|uniref:AraC-like DNA-binding protein n=1 Tax=Chitinophaga niastensis TaxID=536980 RepID=A0A2P8HEL4_CHINA|nr:helix-turn-helix domain-containing protein [Chitinophaga niastensis]PSL44666.1 AraC-like DNA-binding protein [Chitinophaga niastensis]